MKKTGLFLLLLLALLTKTVFGYTTTADDEIVDLASVVLENNLAVEDWQVTIKEQVTRAKADKLVQQLKNSYLASTTNDVNVIKYSFSDAQKQKSVVESFKVIVPKNANYKAEVIAVIRGDYWDQSIKQAYYSTINALPESLFTKQAKEFACLTTESNGTISSDDFLKAFMNELKVKQILTQTDNINHSTVGKIIYGYTPLWNQEISIMDKTMNIQLAMNENENGDTTFTIGTPILITEY